jgi:hypothetical protein
MIWQAALADAQANATRARQVQRRLLAFIHAWQVRQALRRAQVQTFVGVAVCILGILVFMSAFVH